MLVLEKDTGASSASSTASLHSTVLDLAVNSASERGLLGIALHPRFRQNGFVYLFWTESSTGADTARPRRPCRSSATASTGSSGTDPRSTSDRNLIRLRAFQADEGQPLRGNHNGGVIVFGPDEDARRRRERMTIDAPRTTTAKLYIQVGDTGRRGQLQNLEHGPFGPGMPDDQFGGPEPDNAHLTGVILRLNDDGTTPRTTPSTRHGARVGGEVGGNIQKIFAYGLRNGFGMAFDPVSGDLWEQENGDDSFSELNRVEAGMNSGWVQIMGPVERIAQFKEIETSRGVLRAAADPLAADEHRGLARGGPAAAVHAAGRPLQQPEMSLEIRGRARRHPVRRRAAAWAASTRTT